jgi:hypothetical protein
MTTTTTTATWNDCKPLLRRAQAAGYDVLPIKDGAVYLLTVKAPGGQRLGVARGATWAEAARAAVQLVERDQQRRAA